MILLIEGNCRLKQAIIRDRRYPNLYLIPSAQTKDKTAVNPEQMKKLTEALKEEFDYILLDCPAGIEQGFLNAIAGATRAIVVTTPEVSAIRDADRVIGLLESAEMESIQLIINRIRIDMVRRGDMMSMEDVKEILAVELLGIVPDDEEIVISTNRGEPLTGGDSPAGIAYSNICKRLLGYEVPFLTFENKTGLLAKVSGLFKR